ncbi:MAG TPA: CPBP family intramembrane glutamic endopeptidase [Nocardioides sp.]
MVTIATVVAGAVVLGLMLRFDPGSVGFYTCTVVLAGVWALGAFLAGPVHLGRSGRAPGHRPLVAPLLVGLGLVALFTVGALVVREIPPLEEAVRDVVSFTGEGVAPGLVVVTLVAGVAEELFFRGALYDAVHRHPVAVTTVVYVLATAATGNVMLAFAAALLGVVTGLQRRATGGVLAGAVTHVTWSVGMLFLLPLLFGPA